MRLRDKFIRLDTLNNASILRLSEAIRVEEEVIHGQINEGNVMLSVLPTYQVIFLCGGFQLEDEITLDLFINRFKKVRNINTQIEKFV